MFTWDTVVAANGKTVKATSTTLYDAATEPLMAKALAANESVSMPYTLRDGAPAGGFQVHAVLFADGSAWGEQAWITRLNNRRTYMSKHLAAAVNMLRNAVASGAERSLLITQVQVAPSSAQTSTDVDERRCAATVWGLLQRNLQQVTRRADGGAAPLAEVIDHDLSTFASRLNLVRSVQAP